MNYSNKTPEQASSASIQKTAVVVTRKKAAVKFSLPTSKKPTLNQGRWTKSERLAFLRGLRKFGKSKWKEISKLIPTRDTTQTKTHAQTVLRLLAGGQNIFAELDSYEKQKEKKGASSSASSPFSAPKEREEKVIMSGTTLSDAPSLSNLNKTRTTSPPFPITFTTPRTSKAASALIMLKTSARNL